VRARRAEGACRRVAAAAGGRLRANGGKGFPDATTMPRCHTTLALWLLLSSLLLTFRTVPTVDAVGVAPGTIPRDWYRLPFPSPLETNPAASELKRDTLRVLGDTVQQLGWPGIQSLGEAVHAYVTRQHSPALVIPPHLHGFMRGMAMLYNFGGELRQLLDLEPGGARLEWLLTLTQQKGDRRRREEAIAMMRRRTQRANV
jgi:hypothetical protein